MAVVLSLASATPAEVNVILAISLGVIPHLFGWPLAGICGDCMALAISHGRPFGTPAGARGLKPAC